MIKLDYTIESPEERKAFVEKILEENPDLSPQYLDYLADYLVLCMEKQEKKEKKILTENRMITVNKRECSYEGLASQLENGEDGIYNMMVDNKSVIFQPKISITQEDIDTIPLLPQLRETIAMWEKALKKASGREAYIIKKGLIEMRKEQYVMKQAYQKPIIPQKVVHNDKHPIQLNDKTYLDSDRNVQVRGVSLMNPKIVSAILANYSKLKAESYGSFISDTWYLLESFEGICDEAFEYYPIYERVLELKIDKQPNLEIQRILLEEFDKTYSIEYISRLWSTKIPKMIAKEATNQFLRWQYNIKNLPTKTCSRCGKSLPRRKEFFTRNGTSRDGFYSMCKKCRSSRRKQLRKGGVK